MFGFSYQVFDNHTDHVFAYIGKEVKRRGLYFLGGNNCRAFFHGGIKKSHTCFSRDSLYGHFVFFLQKTFPTG